MLRLRATVLAVLLVVAGYTTAQYTRSAWDPQPAPLRIPAVEAAYHPKVDPTSYWNYQRSGRTPSRSMLSKMMTSSGAITLSGAAIRLAPGATGSNLTLTGDLVLPLASFASAGTNTLAGAMPLNLTATTAGVWCSSASPTTACYIESGASAAAAGATSASSAIKVFPDNALDATDYVFSVGNAANATSLFNVTYGGNAFIQSTMSAGNHVTVGGVGGLYTGATAGTGCGSCYVLQAGAVTDAAAAIALQFGGATLTAGVDRYIAAFYSDNFSTVRARVFTNGTYQNLYTAGTAGSGTGITVNVTSAVLPFVHELTIINTALTAAATTDLTVWTTPVDTRLVRITANVTQVFTGGALTAMTFQCGKSAGTNEYLVGGSVFTAQTVLGDVQAEVGAGLLSATLADMGTPAAGVAGAIAISCRFTCTTANCNAATQGSLKLKIEGVTY